MSRFNRSVASLGVIVGVASAPVVHGQSPDSLSPGTRIRVDLPTADRSRFHRERVQSVVGTLESARADTLLLVVRSGGLPLRIPRVAVQNLYVSRGRPPRWRGALDAALLPALVTAALSAAGASIHRKEGDPSPSQMALSSAAWVGASSAILGAWSPKERWRRISRPESITSYASSTRD